MASGNGTIQHYTALQLPGEGAIIIAMEKNTPNLWNGAAVVKGGGDLGTGVVYRLYQAGLRVLVTELPTPLVIRRAVALATAIDQGVIEIEGMVGRRVDEREEIDAAWRAGQVPVLVDPQATIASRLCPLIVVDAIMAKKNLGTRIDDAPIVIALGPGFVAGRDAHAVIETQRGHRLGRALYRGAAAPNTGLPGATAGVTARRVLRAPVAGRFKAVGQIGDRVQSGQLVARVDGQPVRAAIDGVLRGLLSDGLEVKPGFKVGDVDPRGVVENCFLISDKALAIGGGVLEATLFLAHRKGLI